MKIKFGSLVVDGRGKIGGHVASKNRAGAYLRTKVTPVNPNTSYQAGVRNALATQSAAWGALTQAQIIQWNDAVADFQKTDIFGDLKKPSGFNLFQRLNNNLVRIGESALSVPPLPQEIPIIETGVLAAVHAGAMTLTFTNDPVITDSVVEVSATPALSPGRSFVKSQFRRIGALPALTDHVSTLTTIYGDKFGDVGAADMKVFIKLKQISKTSGQAGIPVIYSAIIT